MSWPKGKKLSEQHRRKIRASVLSTIPLRRRRRTRAQRLRDADLDPRSLGKRVLTPKPEWWKKGKQVQGGIKVYGVKPAQQEVQTILNGRIKLIGHGKPLVLTRPAERVQFV